MKEVFNRAEVLVVYHCAYRTLLNAVFMTRLGDVFMEKSGYGIFRDWDSWGAISVSGDVRTNWTDPGSGSIL